MSTGRGLLSLPWGDAGGGGAAIGHDSNGRTVRYDVAGLLGAGPAVQALASNFAATAAAISAPTAAVQMAAEQRRLAAVTGIEADIVLSPIAGAYFARGVGSVSGDLAAWAAGMGGAFTRPSAGTYFGPAGLMLTAGNNVPRIEYDQYTGDKLGLLFEPASTNLALRSTDVSVTPWGVGPNATISGTTVTAPDGSAAKVLVMNAAGNAFVSQGGIAGTSGTIYTMPAWLQLVAGGDTLTTNSMALYLRDAGGATTSFYTPPAFTLTKGIWRRVWVAAKTLADGTLTIVPIFDRSGYSIAIWGAGLEPRASPTSDILTAGTSAARATDALSVPLLEPGLYSPSQGAYLVELRLPVAVINAGSATEYFSTGIRRNGQWISGVTAQIAASGGAYTARMATLDASGAWIGASESVSPAAAEVIRLAASWTAAGVRYSINGRAVTGSPTPPPATGGAAEMRVSSGMPAHLRRMVYFRAPVTDAQLQALSATTW